MLTFFRRIRKELLGGKRASKYMLYAIGEILLVMIGILLALQVNNWNQSTIQATEEKHILKELSTSAREDIIVLQNRLERIRDVIQHINSLKAQMYSGELIDSLDILCGSAYGFHEEHLNTASYETLKSKGFDLISKDSIRLLIIRIYDAHLKKLESMNITDRNVILEVLREYYLTHFSNIEIGVRAVPNDPKYILSDKYYLNLIEYRQATLTINQAEFYPKLIRDLQELAIRIDTFLSQKG